MKNYSNNNQQTSVKNVITHKPQFTSGELWQIHKKFKRRTVRDYMNRF